MTSISPMKLAGLFWNLPVGVILAAITLFEGSLIWSAFCIITGWIGFAAGFGGSVSLADKMESEFKSGGTVALARPKLPGLKDIFLFWGPSLAVVWLGQAMLARLPADLRPRSYDSFHWLSFIESCAMYFCWIGAAFYETWRRTRNPTTADADGASDDAG